MTAFGDGPVLRKMLAIFDLVGDHGIAADELQQRLYGTQGKAERFALHMTIRRLRASRPDLVVEKRYVYRIRRASP